MRRLGFVLLIGLLVAGGAYAYRTGWLAHGLDLMRNATAAPEVRTAAAPPQVLPVEIAQVRASRTTTDISAVGSLGSDESVQVASEVAGRIAEIRFTEGQKVKAGDVLVKLDDALVRASEAEMQARLALARSNYDRAQQLQKSGSGTARALDEAISERNTATALLDLQQVQLAKHSILAPFDGVVGLRAVSVGAYIGVGEKLVNLEKIDTLKIDFKIPEIYLSQIVMGQSVEIAVDAVPGRTFTGAIYAIDPMVDVNGRALSIRAKLSNQDNALRPGLFVRVTVKGGVERTALMVPESAVVPRGQDRIVWQVREGKAVETKVKLGERRAGEVEIAEGLPANATVVTAGQQRLRAGARVEVVGGPSVPQS
ncbi:MAG TPA: efflux RND transporter periplasmic adaptor subunit [Xanthobacteraceae bacterium]|nr:efflux RND transporter periplasmic adaptor subunit [Xanthobacteraceae bacterium]